MLARLHLRWRGGAARVCAFSCCSPCSACFLCGILGSKFSLFRLSLCNCLLLRFSFSSLRRLSLQSLFLCLLFCWSGFAFVLFPLALLFFFLPNSFDARVEPQRQVDESSKSCIVFLLASCSFGFVLLFCVSLVVAAKGEGKR